MGLAFAASALLQIDDAPRYATPSPLIRRLICAPTFPECIILQYYYSTLLSILCFPRADAAAGANNTTTRQNKVED